MAFASTRITRLPDWERAAKELKVDDRGVDDLVADVAHEVESEAKRLVPVDTGVLKNKIVAFPVRRKVWKVVAGTNYAVFVEYGTRPHAVAVRHLRGWAKRRGVSAGGVAHAIRMRGTPARPFMRPAVQRARKLLQRRLR